MAQENLDMTERLDAEFSELHDFLQESKRSRTDEDAADAAGSKERNTTEQKDQYDMAVRSLTFDARAKATDRLKTAEEIAQEEKAKLEKQEVIGWHA